MSPAGKDQLHGWKEIAAYLGRDERTAKRWEKSRGLPVRRIPGGGRANVYILVAELEAWFILETHATPREPVEGDVPRAVPPLRQSQDNFPPASPQESVPASPVEKRAFASSGFFSSKTSRLWSAGAALLALVLGGAVSYHVAAMRSALPAIVHPVDRPERSAIPAEPDEQYLRAVYLLEQRTPDALQSALRDLSEVVARNPRNAQAHAKIAITYILLREYSLMPHRDAYQRAEEAAEQALALDPNLSEAHAALGFIQFFFEWQPARAAASFRTAIQLDPTCVLAHHWYGSMLMHQARFPEALKELTLAQRYAPTSPSVLSSKALALGLAGHREEAMTMLRTLTTIDPNAAAPHRYLAALSLIEPRNVPQYLAEMQRFSIIRKDVQEQLLMKKAIQAYHRGGQRAVWEEMLSAARKTHPRESEPSFARAEAESLLGQRDLAMADLVRLSDQHDPEMIGILVAASLAPLRMDPRLPNIIQRVGLLDED